MHDPAPTVLFVWSTGIPFPFVTSEPTSCVGYVQIFDSCRLVTETSILFDCIQDAAVQHLCHNFCTHMRRWLLLCRNRMQLQSCGYLGSQTSRALSTNTRLMSTFAGLKDLTFCVLVTLPLECTAGFPPSPSCCSEQGSLYASRGFTWNLSCSFVRCVEV